jgi:hypothetical protein
LIDGTPLTCRHTEIESQPDHQMTRTLRLARHLQQQTGELAPPPQQIVRPFERKLLGPKPGQGLGQRRADGQTHPTEMGRRERIAPQQRQIDIDPER